MSVTEERVICLRKCLRLWHMIELLSKVGGQLGLALLGEWQYEAPTSRMMLRKLHKMTLIMQMSKRCVAAKCGSDKGTVEWMVWWAFQ